ncbi:MAG: twin-arginine translocase subunit TatC [Candidatus Omnitrophica bacterium]|nr:twin-arginine translocase subunit TatC [Candidatus Omnitrophota bacterium]
MMPADTNEKKMPVLEHLRELRRHLLWSVGSVAVLSMVLFYWADPLLMYLARPVPRLVFIGPSEAFVARLKVAFMGGLILSMPLVLYHAGAFVWPALKDRERRLVGASVWAVVLFFALGVAFAFFLAVPVGLKFLMGFGGSVIEPMLSADRYLSFVGAMLLVFGIVFELPVLLVVLSRIGIVTPAFLRQKRAPVIVAIFIVAAIVTPPDVVSQCLVAIPMILLYELGILLSYWLKSRGA